MAERSFALFDIDNTIYQGYVIFGLAQAQVDERLLAKRSLDQLYKDTDLYNSSNGQVSYETYAEQAMTHWAEGLVGKPYKKVLTHAQEFLNDNRRNFYNFFEVLTEQLRGTHNLYLVTAEPQFICQAIGSMFPVTSFASSEFNVNRRGRFTGMAKVLATSQDKDLAIASMLASHNLDNSIAFGDASSDEDMLERATYKICVDHPKSTLRNIVLKKRSERGWFVVHPDNIIERVSELLKK